MTDKESTIQINIQITIPHLDKVSSKINGPIGLNKRKKGTKYTADGRLVGRCYCGSLLMRVPYYNHHRTQCSSSQVSINRCRYGKYSKKK